MYSVFFWKGFTIDQADNLVKIRDFDALEAKSCGKIGSLKIVGGNPNLNPRPERRWFFVFNRKEGNSEFIYLYMSIFKNGNMRNMRNMTT